MKHAHPHIPKTRVVGPDPSIYENTPVLSKILAVTIQQGTVATAEYEFRDRDGYIIDLSGLFPCKDWSPMDKSKRSLCDDIWPILDKYSRKRRRKKKKPECDCTEECKCEPCDCPADCECDDCSEDCDDCDCEQECECEKECECAEECECDDCEEECDDECECEKECTCAETKRKPRKKKKRCRLGFYMEARIQPADEPLKPMWIVPVQVVDAKKGLLRFRVPDQPSRFGGIYVISLGLCRRGDGRPLYIQRVLLNVERSAWRDPRVDCKCPTLSEIRMRIMDTDVENLLQGYVEFTTADILDSIVSAVREWNGTTPHMARHVYTCYTFPWVEPWLNKIVANLYSRAALRYARNKLMVSHGGVQGDDLARDEVYKAIAAQYDKEWKEWMLVKKKALNIEQFSGAVSSPYWQTVNNQRGRHIW